MTFKCLCDWQTYIGCVLVYCSNCTCKSELEDQMNGNMTINLPVQ